MHLILIVVMLCTQSMLIAVTPSAHADGGFETTPMITSIAGSVQEGNTITILGSGFSNHPDYDVMGTEYLCAWYDRFDSYSAVTEGDAPMAANYNFASGGSGAGRVQISTTQARGIKSLYATGYDPMTGEGGGAKIRPGPEPVNGQSQLIVFDDNGVYYWSMWMYFPNDWDSELPDQWKLVRFGPNGNDFYVSCNQQERVGHHSDYTGIGGSECVGQTISWFDMHDQNVQGESFLGRWHRIEIEVNVNLDELRYFIDGHRWYDGHALYGENLFPDDWDITLTDFFDMDQVHHPHPQNVGYYDDIVADNTWARVEISQTPQFTCGQEMKVVKNIQFVKTWEPAEITVDVNLEGLSGTVYVFVVDANGCISDPYPVEIGGDDTIPPCITILTPGDGDTVSGTITISADATDNVGVDRVDFSVDDEVIGCDSSGPYECSWDTSSVADGAHSVSATVYDTSGNVASVDISIEVLNQSVEYSGILEARLRNTVVQKPFPVILQARFTNTGPSGQFSLSVDILASDGSVLVENARGTAVTLTEGGVVTFSCVQFTTSFARNNLYILRVRATDEVGSALDEVQLPVELV
ncbi:MAG: hypothetical protein JXA00_01060 [Candidatus Thermoplasmatota archaeon]|nr:hypothetical protein [Candidatus Thermoplasmatota archaeon]